MSEEEVKPISKSKSKQQPKTHWFCNKCGNDFWGAKKVAECPQCGEDMDLMVLNEDGLPLEDVRRIVKKRFELASSQPDDPTWGDKQQERPKLTLDLSREALSRASELSADMFERDVDEGIRDQISSNIKAKALKSKRELLEEQRKIEELNDNEEHAPSSEMYPAPNPQGAAMLMQAISGMEEGQQELFFERIKDPQVAHNLALILNPPKQTMYGVAPNMPNPMGMALQSITGQPQVSSPNPEPSNQLNMVDVMAAMGEMMKNMQEMVLKNQPSTEGASDSIKEALGELKQNYDKVNENIYDLKLKQIEGQAGGGVSGGITKEDLDELMEQKLEGLKKSPKDTLKEIKEMILEVDTLRNSIKGELPEQREPFEEWHKRHELEREAAKDKAESDKKVKEIERDTERYKAIHQTLQDGIREAMSRKPKEKEEGGEEKIEIPLKKKVTLVR